MNSVTLEMVVAEGKAQFPGLYVTVDVSQSTYGYPRATAAVLGEKPHPHGHVATLAFPETYGSCECATAAEALEGLLAAIRANAWKRTDTTIASDGGGL